MRDFAVCFLALFLAAPALAQQLPRTADGHPDLQGTWDGRSLTPLERPDGVMRLVVNATEAAQMARQKLAARDNPQELDPAIAVPDAFELAHVGAEYRTSLIVEPADGKLPLTALGQSMVARFRIDPPIDGPESRPPVERCIAGPGEAPFNLTAGGNFRQIIQTPGVIAIHTEAMDAMRLVRIDARHDPANAASPLGDGVGHWEGDTLVVETVVARPDHRAGIGVIVRPASRIVERFTLLSPDELRYRFTVEDPDIYAKPWLAEYSLTRSDHRLFEWSCHEANYSLAYTLAGALRQQRQAGTPAHKKAKTPRSTPR